MKNRTRQDRQSAPARKDSGLVLRVQPEEFGICRLGPRARTPRWVHKSSFYSISRSLEELSIVCEERLIPDRARSERGWRMIQVTGTLDMALIGVLESLARPLTQAGVSIFTISTFDTDYLLVRSKNLKTAIAALEGAGHSFDREPIRPAVPKTESEETKPEESEPEETQPEKPAGGNDAASASEAREPTEEGDSEPPSAPPSQDLSEAEDPSPERPKKRRRRRRRRRRPAPEKQERASGADVEADQEADPPKREAPMRDEHPARLTGAEALPDVASVEQESDAVEQEIDVEVDAEAEPTPKQRGTRDRVVKALSDLFAGVRNGTAKNRPEESTTLAAEDGTVDDSAATDVTAGDEAEIAAREATEAAAPPTKKRRRRRRQRKPGAEERPEETRAEKSRNEDPPPSADPNQPDDPPVHTEPPARRARDERPDSQDEGDDSTGLYTGAIPQEPPVELTEGNFEPLGLSEPILRTIAKVGFTHPTPIQAGVIPQALEGRDIIGLAETGSGKTAAFSLPLAERLTHGRGIRGLILCPTREIALQTKAFLDLFGKDHALETVAVIGGVKKGPQISGFRRKADILVATPGRLADHLRRRNLELNQLQELVLDEADHMLDLGFLPQIREILEQVPGGHRTMMFSATMPPPIENLTKLFMNDPVRVDVRPEGHVASGIEHRLYLVKEEDMKDCVTALLQEIEGSTLIFTRRKLYTEWLSRQLDLAGFAAARIHSDRSQAQRVRALRGFREGEHRILVATDVAARGLDIPRIEHVINYSLPETPEDYVHRAGRTARGQAAGIVSSIGTWQDKITIRDLESRLNIQIPRCTAEGIEPWVELKKRKTVRRRRML